MAAGITRNGNDRDNYFIGTGQDDTLRGNGGDDTLEGRDGNDLLSGGSGRDQLFGQRGNDRLFGGDGADRIFGGSGNDDIFAGSGDDRVTMDVSTGGSDRVDFGSGSNVAVIRANSEGQVRLTFTSSEVGNGDAVDSDTMANQDGGLAVRLQREDEDGNPIGPVSRLSDEMVTFVADTDGLTFDVRDLVSGTERGDDFEVVTLGSEADDRLTAQETDRPYYINAGMGDDAVIGGDAEDFLVGGAGDDLLVGKSGDDSFIGGGGNDRILGGSGNDAAIFNVSSDGEDSVDLSVGADVLRVSAADAGQVRLTFTSSEVGNGNPLDSATAANQDGGLAVRLQAEDGSDGLTGPITRVDDEGITFASATPGVTFDVRDLVTGAARGDQFQVVRLGTQGGDGLNAAARPDAPYYFNAGMGADQVIGGSANDFLVGGGGDDMLRGSGGNDTFIGGAGNDRLAGNAGMDVFIFNAALDRETNVDEIVFFEEGDSIRLDDMVFIQDNDAALMTGPLDPEAFSRATERPEGDDRIIYNQDTGNLFFDGDGGSRDDAVRFARISNSPNGLDAGDFVVI